jgi:hypothetical protein
MRLLQRQEEPQPQAEILPVVLTPDPAAAVRAR